MAYLTASFTATPLNGGTNYNTQLMTTAFTLDDEYFVLVHAENNPNTTLVSVYHSPNKIGNDTPTLINTIQLDNFRSSMVSGYKLSNNRFIVLYQGQTYIDKHVKAFNFDGSVISEIASYSFINYGMTYNTSSGLYWRTANGTGKYFEVYVVSDSEFILITRGNVTNNDTQYVNNDTLYVNTNAFKLDLTNQTFKHKSFAENFPSTKTLYQTYFYDLHVERLPETNYYFITRMCNTSSSSSTYDPDFCSAIYEIYFDNEIDDFVIRNADNSDNPFTITDYYNFVALDKNNVFQIHKNNRGAIRWTGYDEVNGVVSINSFGDNFEFNTTSSVNPNVAFEQRFIKISDKHFIAYKRERLLTTYAILFKNFLKINDTTFLPDNQSLGYNGYYKQINSSCRSFVGGNVFYFENNRLIIFYLTSTSYTANIGISVFTP